MGVPNAVSLMKGARRGAGHCWKLRNEVSSAWLRLINDEMPV